MKKSCLLIIALFSINFLFAQDEDSYVYGDSELKNKAKNDNKPLIDWSRVSVGGGLGATFGNVTFIEVAPTAAYFVTDHFLYGIGLSYVYYEDKIFRYKTSTYGARVYSQYLLDILPVLGHVEAELINVDSFSYPGTRINVVNLYVGGGLNQKMGDRSYFYLLMLWNLNDYNDAALAQPNPIVRVGVAVGI
jgi:long-subunit fatty acid transport protein